GSSVNGANAAGTSNGSPPQPKLGNGSGGPGGTLPINRNDACVQSSAAADADKNPPHGQSKWAITAAALKAAVAKLPGSVALGINFYPNTSDDSPCIRNRVALAIAPLGDAGSRQRNHCDQAIDN